MADLSVTATQVIPATSGSFDDVWAGEAIDCGENYYIKAADGKAYRGLNVTSAEANVRGICVSAAKAANQRMSGQRSGLVTLGAGAAPAVGTPYFVGANAGKICPLADLGSGAYVTFLGVGAAGNKIDLNPVATGIAHA